MRSCRPVLLFVIVCALTAGACGEFEDEPHQVQQALTLGGVGMEAGGEPSGLGTTPSGEPNGLGTSPHEEPGGLGCGVSGEPSGVAGQVGGGGLSGQGGCNGLCAKAVECFSDEFSMDECLEGCSETLQEEPEIVHAAVPCVAASSSCAEVLVCLQEAEGDDDDGYDDDDYDDDGYDGYDEYNYDGDDYDDNGY